MRLTLLFSLLGLVAAVALVTATMRSVAAAEGETVSYRFVDWKTMHFDDAKKGSEHLEAVKKLGCEVKKDEHGGHLDVSYRCKDWKELTVETHDRADQWAKWLKSAGFETKHAH